MSKPRNVLGTELEVCGCEPMTGWRRTGSCETDESDVGRHVICARMTAEFLEFSRVRGNDLVTPVPAVGFPGLGPGDRWCICAERWKQALEAGVAPPVFLLCTEESALEVVELPDLEGRALDLN